MNSPANSTFWAFLRFETVKMFHRRITWVPFGVIVIVVALVVAVFHYSDFKTQLTFLKARHCNEGQGYLFSRPLAAENFTRRLMSEIAAASGEANTAGSDIPAVAK